MKRLITLALLLSMLCGVLASCSAGKTTTSTGTTEPATPVYNITYVLDGGDMNGQTNPATFDGTVVLLNDPVKEGFEFLGWFTDPEGEGERYYTLNGFTADTTLYAVWLYVEYTIYYEMFAKDAINSSANLKGYNTGTPETPLMDAARPGYTFGGWYYDPGLTNPCTSYSGADKKNLTLYAKWDVAPSKWVTTAPTIVPDHPNMEDEVAGDYLLLTDMDNGVVATHWGGTQISATARTESGDGLVTWASMTAKNQLAFNKLTTKDLTGYTNLEFYMYNANPTGGTMIGTIWTTITNPTTGKNEAKAAVWEIKLDWTGWKRISLDLSGAKWSMTGFPGLSAVTDFRFMVGKGSWSANIVDGSSYTNPDYAYTYIYVDDLYLVNYAPEYQPDTSLLTEANMTAVKNNWRDMLVGNETLNADPVALAKAKSAGNNGISYANSMAADPMSVGYLWADKTSLTTESVIDDTYGRITAMAKAWGSYGSAYYHDEALFDKIILAMEFMLNYDADGDGTPGVYGANVAVSRPGNWWQWQIGIPMDVVDTLMIIEDQVSDEFIAKMLAPVDICCPSVSATMANRTWIAHSVLGSALLQNKGEELVKAIDDVMDIFDYVTTGDGMYEDGSFVQHHSTGYIHGYGGSMIDDFTFELSVFAGTAFDIEVGNTTFFTKYADRFLDFIADSWEPFVYRGITIWTLSGRGMSMSTVTGSVAQLFRIAGHASADKAERFYSMVRYYESQNSALQNLNSHISYPYIAAYAAYQARTDITPRSDYYYSAVYAGMDRALTRTDDYTALVSMSSTRMYRFEAINGQGSTGWYIADGALFLYGNDYERYYSHSNINRHKLPGTTVSTTQRTQQQYTTDTCLYNHSSFVGGVSNGSYGVSAMVLKYLPTDNIDAFKSDLKAQKAYFFFDDEIVCLGSDISATNNAEYQTGNIITVVANELTRWNMNGEITVNGEVLNSYGDYPNKLTGVSYVTLGSAGGYYFPVAKDSNVTLTNVAGGRTELVVDHGKGPEGAEYAYVILPEMAPDAVAAYAQSSDIKVLINSNLVSAVEETTLGMTGYVFWYNVKYDGITPSDACIITKTEKDDGSLEFAVSEPTQKIAALTVTLDGEWDVTGDARVIGVSVANGKTVVTLNTDRNLGATINFTATAK